MLLGSVRYLNRGVATHRIFLKEKRLNLVGESKTTHTGLDTEHVVVGCEHVESCVVWGSLHGYFNLGVVNAREVAGASRLVLLGLKSE